MMLKTAAAERMKFQNQMRTMYQPASVARKYATLAAELGAHLQS